MNTMIERKNFIGIRVSDNEKKFITNQAHNQHQNISQYMRQRLGLTFEPL